MPRWSDFENLARFFTSDPYLHLGGTLCISAFLMSSCVLSTMHAPTGLTQHTPQWQQQNAWYVLCTLWLLLTKHTTRRWPIESYMCLEEELIELQNMNWRLAIDYAENKRKKELQDEIDNLHRIVGGMTVPLRQFGEKSIGNKTLASRTVVTSVGGDHVQHKFGTPWQQRTINDLAGTR